MKFIEAMKIKKRMCEDDIGDCIDCPFTPENNGIGESCDDFIMLYPEKAEEILTKWAEEHPAKTIFQDFLEKYPNAKLNELGNPPLCPGVLGYSKEHHNDCMTYADCFQCWNRPLEE